MLTSWIGRLSSRALPATSSTLMKGSNHFLLKSTTSTTRPFPSTLYTTFRYFSQEPTEKIISNHDIPGKEVRLVTFNAEGKKESKIVSKAEALAMAQQQKMDLIAINPDAKPAVCKLDKVSHIVHQLKKKEKAIRAAQRAHTLKEILITLGIDKHDFTTKMNKVKSLILDGHPVKLYLLPRRRKTWTKAQFMARKKMERAGIAPPVEPKNPFNDVDETSLMILTAMEDMPVALTQKDIFVKVPEDAARKPLSLRPKDGKAPIDEDETELDDEDEDDEDEAAPRKEKPDAPVRKSAGPVVMVKVFTKREFNFVPKLKQMKTAMQNEKKEKTSSKRPEA